MEIPDLVRQELGDEEIQAGVNLGDEDAVCFTSTRTLVYRGEGLLSDEKVSVHPHDFERLTVSEGRRKTKFTLYYTDQKRDFAVPNDRASVVLERLLEGKLRVSGGIGDEETVAGVFRFSELTLVVTDNQLLKHLGNVTWDADFEAHPFEDVTGLDFEEGSVATAIVLAVNDRPERIKAPAEQAPSVRKALQEALFAYHEVGSLSELNAKVGTEPEEDDGGSGLGLESGIDPLVSDDSDGTASEPDPAEESGEAAATQSAATGQEAATTTTEATAQSDPSIDGAATDHADIEALERQVAELTAAVEQQSERIERQEQTIKTLIKELRQGR